MIRYHITTTSDPGGFGASALADLVGGTVRSTVPRYNSDGDDLALIDVPDDVDQEYFEQALDDDESVIRYSSEQR